MSGLTTTGFAARTVEEIIADFEQAQRLRVDPALNTSATSVLGNLNAVYALALAELWEVAQLVYDSHDPAAASGVALDAIGALRAVRRREASASSVTLRLALEAGATVAAGSVVSQQGNPLVRFVTQDDVVATSAGEYNVLALAEEVGPTVAGAGTLSIIESPSSGWTAVTNPAAATTGSDVETDTQYRLRQLTELSKAGSSTPAGIAADVSAVSGVHSVSVLENVGDAVDADGMPPHSFEVVAVFDGPDDGETAQAIAEAIWRNKPAGIAVAGAISVDILDEAGEPQSVKFTRPQLVSIGIRWKGTFGAEYNAADGVLEAITRATSNPEHPAYFGVGADVHLARILDTAMDAVGVVNLTINIARDALPGSAVPTAMNYTVAIAPRERAQIGLTQVDP